LTSSVSDGFTSTTLAGTANPYPSCQHHALPANPGGHRPAHLQASASLRQAFSKVGSFGQPSLRGLGGPGWLHPAWQPCPGPDCGLHMLRCQVLLGRFGPVQRLACCRDWLEGAGASCSRVPVLACFSTTHTHYSSLSGTRCQSLSTVGCAVPTRAYEVHAWPPWRTSSR
jgi:hypothetical protein